MPAELRDTPTTGAGSRQTTNTYTDGGLVFYLFNKTSDTTYSVSYYLGLDLSQFTYAGNRSDRA